MSKEEREPFDNKAKAEKERSRNPVIEVVPKSYTQRQHENFSRVQTQGSNHINEEEDREEYFDKMIECCVKACPTREDLIGVSFFLISSNVMLETDDHIWIP